jgi:hypothetical protein
VLIGCDAWWSLFPVLPGYSIAALAFVAVIMTVRTDHFTPAERIIWVLIGAILMFGEVRILYLDRHNADAKQQEDRQQQEQRFETTIKAFTVLLNKEDRTLHEAARASINSEKGLENITGGDTFIVLTRWWGDVQGTSPVAQPTWTAFSMGGAMLHSVTVEITDANQMEEYFKKHRTDMTLAGVQGLATHVSLGDFAPTFGRFVEIGLLPQKRTALLQMNFFAMNGTWSELYACREINGNMKAAIKVERITKSGNKLLFKSTDKGFPVDKQGRPLDEKGVPMWK